MAVQERRSPGPTTQVLIPQPPRSEVQKNGPKQDPGRYTSFRRLVASALLMETETSRLMTCALSSQSPDAAASRGRLTGTL